jgi:UDP-N-acetylmuramoylalanine--D-glutamate ligase
LDYKGKRVMVVGMAKSGIACAKLLYALGANVILNDNKQLNEFSEEDRKTFDLISKERYLGKNPIAIIETIDSMVLSPGVPPKLDFIQKAYELKKEVIAEMELGYRYSKADIIAITGTNGKTTCTALTGAIFENTKIKTYILGNIGVPFVKMAPETKSGDMVVLESAALQLETIVDFKPRVSAVLNITEDHLDRFLTMDYYISCKERVFENQGEYEFCVLNYDNEITRNMADKSKAKTVWFSRNKILDYGAFIKDGNLIFKDKESETFICKKSDIRIPGNHNVENALACAAMAYVCNVKPKTIEKTLKEFPGVEHRIEHVRELDGVRYINDSKGTNPDATINAINAMDRPTVLILGGFDKKSDFDDMFMSFNENIKTVIALGETKDNLLKSAIKAGFKDIYTASTFNEAVLKAKDKSNKGYNVLLSPACASYDMFTNFEQRGEVFKDIVNSF